MAAPIHVKAKGEWKDISVDPKILSQAGMGGFVCLQELTDYEIIQGSPSDKRKRKKAADDCSRPKKKSKFAVSTKTVGRHDPGSSTATLRKSEKKDGGVEKNDKHCPDEPKSKKKKKGKKLKPGRGKMVSGEVVDVLASEEPACEKSPATARNESGSAKSKAVKSTKHRLKKEMKAHSPNQTDTSAWKDLFVPSQVLKGLAELGFSAPTPIQTLVLPSAIRDKMDIIGAAETGSGKTLAFGIPLLHHILEFKKSADQEVCRTDSGVESDDDTRSEDEDTREDTEAQSAEEASEVLELPAIVVESDEECTEEECDLPPSDGEEDNFEELEEGQLGCVRVVNNVTFDWLEEAAVAQCDAAADRPLLALILTPTRELAIQVNNHIKAAAKYTDIKTVVIVGGMAAQKQERLLKRCPDIVIATPGRLWELIQQGDSHLSKVEDVRHLVIDEADRMVEKGHFQELSKLLVKLNSDETKQKRRQNLIFSATLTMVHSGPDRYIKKKKKEKMTSKQKLEALMGRIGIAEKPKVVDLTKKAVTAETLTEARITCSLEDKDLYLYYFLHRYPGRTLVFTNSKDCVRRLVTVFSLLQCCPLPLHADMHQKQRLKNLERFQANARGVLLATDVAARGLDIPDVQHVIHYQVPKTTENYVHRSGRTARALKEGLSVMLVGPEDQQFYKRIVKTLNRDEHLQVFPVEDDYLAGLKPRVSLARQIDKDEHRVVRQKARNTWFENAAKEMDIELDESQLQDLGGSHEQAMHKQKIDMWKKQLKNMLKSAVLPKQFSGKYPTKTGKLAMPFNTERLPSAAVDALKEEKHLKKKNRQKKRKIAQT